MWMVWLVALETLLMGLSFLFILWLFGSIWQLQEQVEQLQDFYEELLEKKEKVS